MAVTDTLGSALGGLNFGGGMFTFLKWFIWPVLIGLGGYAIWWFFSYKVTVHIWPGQGSLGTKDKGKKIVDRNRGDVKGFVLLRNKKDYSGQPIPTQFFIPVKKSFGRVSEELHMQIDENGNLHPVIPPRSNDVEAWTNMKAGNKLWMMNSARDAIKAFATRANKYDWLANAAPWFGLVIVVVLMLVLMRQMEGVVQGLNGVASQLSQMDLSRQVIS